MTDRPAPHELWQQVEREMPDPKGRPGLLAPARRDRYRELMTEHGHLVPRTALSDEQTRCPLTDG